MDTKKILFRALAVLLAGGLVMFGLSGCFGTKYHVDYNGQKDCFKRARDEYRAGSQVELYYDLIATDTDYSFWLDGERLNPDYNDKLGYIIRFTMPEHDVSLSVSSNNSMMAVETPEQLFFKTEEVLSYHSFDGGGPDYSVEISDPSIVSCEKSIEYIKQNHAEIEGAGYDITFTLKGLAPGSTTVTVTSDGSTGAEEDKTYKVTVSYELMIAMKELE